MKVHEAVAQALRDAGVGTVFGLVGDANLYAMEGFRQRGGRFVAVANEASAMLCAAGHAAISGGVGVGSVTHGPGLANTAHSLIELVKRRSPCVLVAGDTDPSDTDNFQDIDQRALVAATGARFIAARSASTAAEDLATALRTAARERMPVVFNIPIHLQWADRQAPSLGPAPTGPDRIGADPARLDDAAALIAASRRPIILAGRGAIDARAELIALARTIGAPLATTVQARQLFRDEPLDLGIFGGLATATATEVILESDCVIAFGASLNRWTTASGSLLEGKALVHVDLEGAALGRHALPTAAVQADSAAAAAAIAAVWEEAELAPRSFGGEALQARLAAGTAMRLEERARRLDLERDREATGTRPSRTVDLATALEIVDARFPRDRNLVIDAGRQCITALAVLQVEHPGRYVHTIHFGSIGVGVPYAIGAAIAEPHRPTLLVCGDGGFMLGGLTELHTAVREGIDLTIVVCNDSSFGAEHVQLVRKGCDPALSLFDWPDLAAVARSLGAHGTTVSGIGALEAAIDEAGARSGVTLINLLLSVEELSSDPARNV
jgi:acetolactate synthase-1/2/3 large subunit